LRIIETIQVACVSGAYQHESKHKQHSSVTQHSTEP
jgi:hypothetical protein